MGRGGETDTEWRQRASDAASEALLGVQHALRRERRDRAAEVEGLRQRIKVTPDQQETVQIQEERIARLEARNERLEARLAEAETLELDNLKLDAAREVILTHARAFVRDHGLDDAAMLARMQTGLNEAFAGLDSAGEDYSREQADIMQESRQRDEGLDHGD